MVAFKLTPDELKVVTSFLYGEASYLDGLRSTIDDQTAREVLEKDPTLDLLTWAKDAVWDDGFDEVDQKAEALCYWWFLLRDGKDVQPSDIPTEYAIVWPDILAKSLQIMDAGLLKVSAEARNVNTVPITDAAGTKIEDVAAGDHIALLHGLIEKLAALMV